MLQILGSPQRRAVLGDAGGNARQPLEAGESSATAMAQWIGAGSVHGSGGEGRAVYLYGTAAATAATGPLVATDAGGGCTAAAVMVPRRVRWSVQLSLTWLARARRHRTRSDFYASGLAS